MRYRKDDNSSLIFATVILGVFAVMIFGWGANLYKFTQCDFKSPYKCESIRGFGMPFGFILGYIDIDDT